MKPYRERIEGMSIQFKEQLNSLYEQGYKEGQKSSCDCRDNMDNEYNRGLNDAWKCARKIGHNSYVSLTEMGFEGLDSSRNASFDCIMKFSPSEAIAKIKEYEEKQKAKQTEKSCDNCKYSDNGRTVDEELDFVPPKRKIPCTIRIDEKVDDEIKVGDEVLYYDKNAVVYHINGDYLYCLDGGYYIKSCVEKTGRHFDQIEEVLKALRGE